MTMNTGSFAPRGRLGYTFVVTPPLVLVVLPAHRTDLIGPVRAAGATPVLDLGSGTVAEVPSGVWVRVDDTGSAPGDAGILARSGRPVAGRPCWKEQVDADAPSVGWDGIVLRGRESGGMGGARSVLSLAGEVPAGVRVLLDWPFGPEAPRPAGAGVVLMDVLAAAWAPPRLARRLERLTSDDLCFVAGVRIVGTLASPAARRLASGEALSVIAAGHWVADDAFDHAWPGGEGLLRARGLLADHGSLEALVAAYVRGVSPTHVSHVSPVLAPLPSTSVEHGASGGDGVSTTEEPIAVVGVGCRLPRSLRSGASLWDAILAGFDAVGPVPASRWDTSIYVHPTDPDRTYAGIGAFVDDDGFNPRRFRVPPNTVAAIDPVQRWALDACADALEDAGLQALPAGPGRAFDRERTAVILGNSMGGENGDAWNLRVAVPALSRLIAGTPRFAELPVDARVALLSEWEAAARASLPSITEDSMPGELSNVVAGRVANALDLGGPNFTTDAACASSMAAVAAAVKGLRDGEFDLALTGGADRTMGVATYVKFCRIGALSPDGSRPFDAGANGFVMGEGAGVLCLKRLSDARRDGDRVYAVIRGIGASSDGRGKGITAPNPAGQARALARAYASAGVDPVDVDLFECHGTSTVVGDKVEVDALTDLVGEGRRASRGPARIGSIKGNLGHLKSAAGAASLLKATLALHHCVLPPSIHVRTPRPDLRLERAPFAVQTSPEAWERAMGREGGRFVGVSSFGFGGTNFHVVLEGAESVARWARPRAKGAFSDGTTHVSAVVETTHGVRVSQASLRAEGPPWAAALTQAREMMMRQVATVGTILSASAVAPTDVTELPEGLWAVSADTAAQLAARCRARLRGVEVPFRADSAFRVCAFAVDEAERKDQLERCVTALEKGRGFELLRQRGIHLEDEPCDGGLAFVFTGQGSQYVGMGLALAERFPVVAATFAEADAVMTPLLGQSLTSLLRPDPAMPQGAQEDRLRQTEISQPATLTVDVAILRLLAAYGVLPDRVAGHSLGEYAAAVAAGMLDFRDALLAVSARGREMAAVQIADKGRMAGIATSAQVVAEVLSGIDGYVVAANKNCPTQTVIAGESAAVDAACEAFRARGVQVFPLPVSHAFHSRIVAPATEPLRRVLAGLDLRPPRRAISTNVDASDYPAGEGARDVALDILARQVASPVEWTEQLERMYAAGARVFVECGPKRALTGFTAAIFKGRPHRALATNLPKRGEVESFLDALAGLVAMGFPARMTPSTTANLFASSEPRRSTTSSIAARSCSNAAVTHPPSMTHALACVARHLGVAAMEDLALSAEDIVLEEAARGELAAALDAAKAAFAASSMANPATPTGSPDVGAVAQAMLPALEGFLKAAVEVMIAGMAAPAAALGAPGVTPVEVTPPPAAPAFPSTLPGAASAAPATSPQARIVCSGASLGLPGGDGVFSPDNITRILRGENRIVRVGEAMEHAQLGRKVVRVTKDAQSGEGGFAPVETRDDVIKLAGRKTAFDPAEWGIDKELLRALDITSQLAIAAGYEALRDAGVPLVRTFRRTTSGRTVHTGWALPESWRDDTAVLLASAFPGYDNLVQKLRSNGDDGEGRFDRRFLFQVLNMGHAQFAQLIGARGPNTAVNAACASTTQAIGIAEDWLRLGRARRVIVLGADDVTSDNLFPWIGTGFLAAGAAATDERVEDAALPFDRRRHGMIAGMGALALVLERADDVEARGMAPVAELLGTHSANSAYHGTRLDAEHIARELARFVERTCARAGVTREAFAAQAVFMSHETYTPARGGSAAAEMASLPAAFGEAARNIVIANTKGFTGHAMGAGIEDVVALKVLQYGEVPPIANLLEPDPDLGTLELSRGGPRQVRFALRLAAGFGSQLAFAAWRKCATGDERVVDAPRYLGWLQQEGGVGHLVVEHRQLRWESGARAGAGELTSMPSGSVEASVDVDLVGLRQPYLCHPTAMVTETVKHRDTSGDVSVTPVSEDVLTALLAILASRTGYAVEELEPSFALEADLGVDTVKQAEIIGEVRDRFGLARDDAFRLSDVPTIEAMAAWVARAVGSEGGSSLASSSLAAEPGVAAVQPSSSALLSPPPPVEADQVPRETSSIAESAAAMTYEAALAALVEVVAARTGYAPEELEPGFALEADLGVDTVKQAEIIGELRERFGLVRDDAFRLADYPTLEALARWLASATLAGPVYANLQVDASSALGIDVGAMPSQEDGVEPAPLVTPLVEEAAAMPLCPSDEDSLRVLLGIIASRTGYAVEELEPGFALEADLGVDTVKQAEIVGDVRERFALPRDDAFRLADVPTIADLARWLDGARAMVGSADALVPVGDAEVPGAADISDGADEADRAYLRGLARPAGASLTPSAATSTPPALVAASALLPASFRARRSVQVPRPPVATPSLRGLHVRVLGEGPLANALRANLALLGGDRAGPPNVVIDAGVPARELLPLAQSVDATPPALWLCAVEGGSGDLVAARDAGARAGFAKALGREWPGCHARVLTLTDGMDVDTAAQVVLREVSEAGGAVEVRLGSETRDVSVPSTVAWPSAGTLGSGAVVLLTGGTRGITARVAQALAEAGPCTLLLAGRTGPGPGPLDEAAARHQVRARLEAWGERVTPRRLEEALAPLRAAEEVRRTVASLRALGATVEVLTVDMADPSAVRRMVQDVLTRHGRLDACVHGAGVEESRRLADKDDHGFVRVYAAKAEGGLALAQALPASTVLLSMGSIAGRLGNAGQVDYAAANEAMAQVCARRPRSLHVAWTAWGDVGMAVRGGMEALLTSRGVELLPAAAGAALCRDLLAAVSRDECFGELLVAGALGDFGLPALHPLLDSLVFEGDVAVMGRALSADRDAWLLDHAIDNVPVLPGVIGVEMMVAAAMAALPTGRFVGLEDVRFDAPLKLHGDEPVQVEVRAVPAEDGAVRCTLSSRRLARTGRALHTQHFSAVVQLEAMPLLTRLKPAFLPEETLAARDIYLRFFHGPRFQVLEGVDALALGGLMARARVEHAMVAEGLVTSPLVLEAAFQAAGLHRMVIDGVLALPAAIDAVEPVRAVRDGEPLEVTVQRRGSAEAPVYDIDVDGTDGRVLTVRGFRMVDRGPLPTGDRFQEPVGGWAGTGVGQAQEARVTLSAADVARMTARGTVRRQEDRLAGQLAARRAVAQLVGEEAFEVLRHPSGEPYVAGVEQVAVSITHVEGEALALAARGARAGIDVEVVAPRAPAFVDTWFTEEEFLFSGDDAALTRAWAVKEAVLKALGTGMALSPRDIVVTALDGHHASVRLQGEVAARHAELGGGGVRIRVAMFGARRVVATAILAA